MKNMTGLRWWVIALVALATVINYIDRQSLNVLWPAIAADLYPDKTADEHKQIYAFISVVFVFSYAFGQAIFGKIFEDWHKARLRGLYNRMVYRHCITLIGQGSRFLCAL